MALLATIDIADDGSLKIERFIDVLESLGAATRRTSQEVTDSGKKSQEGINAQTDAITKLANEQRQLQAETLRTAQNTMQLVTAFKAGTVATKDHVEAMKLLNDRVQFSSGLSNNLKMQSAALYSTIQAGTPITAQQAASFQQVAGAMANATAATLSQSTASQKLTVSDIAQAAAALGLLAAIKAYGEEAFRIAARNEVLATNIGIVAKNLNQSGTAFEEQVQQIRALGITTKEAREAVLSFAQANLNLADASKLARAAQNLATIAGINSSQAFSTMTTAVQTTNTMLLRQFGIVQNLDITYREYGQTIGKTTSQMSSQEKQQAILNLILEKSAKSAGAYEASMADVGKAMTSTTRFVEELENKLGQAFLPTVKIVVDWLNETLDALARLPKMFFDVAAGVMVAVGALSSLLGTIGTLRTLTVVLGETQAAALGIRTALTFLTGGWGLVIAAIGVAIGAFVTWNSMQHVSIDTMRENIANAKNLSDSFYNLNHSVDEAAAKVQDYKNRGLEPSKASQDALNDSLKKLNDKFPELQAGFDATTGKVLKNKDAYDKLNQSIQKNLDLEVGVAQKELPKLQKQLADLRQQERDLLNQQLNPKDVGVSVGVIGGSNVVTGAAMAEAAKEQLKQVKHDIKELDAQVQADLRLVSENTSAGIAKMMTEQIKTVTDNYKNLDQVMAKAKVSMKTMQALAADTGDLRVQEANQENLTNMIKKLADASAEIDKFAAAHSAAVQKSVEKWTETGKTSFADFEGLAIALGKLKAGTDEYNSLVVRAAGTLQSFGKEADSVQSRFTILGEALQALPMIQAENNMNKVRDAFQGLARGTDEYDAQLMKFAAQIKTIDALTPSMQAKFQDVKVLFEDLKKIELDKEFQKWTQRAKEFSEAFGLNMEGKFKTITDSMVEDSRKATVALENEKRNQTATLLKYDDELSDRSVGIFQNEVDKKITQNNRWYRDFEKGIRDQITLIKQQEAEELASIERKYKAQVDAFNKEINLAKIKYEIQEIMATGFAATQRAIDANRSQADIDAIKKNISDEIEAYRVKGLQLFKDERDNGLRILDAKKAQNDEYISNLETTLGRAEYANKISNDKIVKESSYAYQFLQREIGSYANSVVEGFSSLVGKLVFGSTTAKTKLYQEYSGMVDEATRKVLGGLDETNSKLVQFKDFFIGIWLEIKKSVLSIVNDIFTAVVKGFLGLGASGQTGMSGLVKEFKNLMGMAAGGGGGGSSVGYLASQSANPLYTNAENMAITGTTGGGGSAGAGFIVSHPEIVNGAIAAGAGIAGGILFEKLGEKWFGPGGKATALGAIGGAGAGAAAGAVFGSGAGPIGIGVGAAAGAIYGVYRSKQNDTKKARDQFLDDLGFKSMDELSAALEAGGKGTELVNTALNKIGRHDAEANAKWMQDIVKALGQIETSKAWDQLVKSAGSADELARKMQLVGMNMADLKMAVDAGDVKAVATQTDELNKLLAEQQTRLEGLGKAASGLKQMTVGFTQTIQRGLKDAFDKLSDQEKALFQIDQSAGDTGLDQLQKINAAKIMDLERKMADADATHKASYQAQIDQIKSSQASKEKSGVTISPMDLLVASARGDIETVKQQNLLKKQIEDMKKQLLIPPTEGGPPEGTQGRLDQAQTELAGLQTSLSPESLERITKVIKDAQVEFSRMGLVATGVFAGIMADTGDVVQAINAISPALDDMIAAQEALGLEADGAFQILINFRKTIKDNEDIANSLSGITQVLKGLGEAGQLTQDEFTAMGDSAADKFKILQERGVDANSALLLMQPTLQALYEAQKKYGFAVDDSTQAMIDLGIENGLVGDNMQDINHQILDVLLAIGEVLGAKLPEAYQKNLDAAKKKSTEDEIKKQKKAWEDAQAAASGYATEIEQLPKPDFGEPPDWWNSGPPDWSNSGGPGDNPPDNSAAFEGYFRKPTRVRVGDDPKGEGEFVLHKSTVETLVGLAKKNMAEQGEPLNLSAISPTLVKANIGSMASPYSAANEGYFPSPTLVRVGDDPMGRGEYVLHRGTVDNLVYAAQVNSNAIRALMAGLSGGAPQAAQPQTVKIELSFKNDGKLALTNGGKDLAAVLLEPLAEKLSEMGLK